MREKTQTILHVEDDPHHAALVLRTLTAIQPAANVVHVEDGEAALQYIEHAKGSDRPALVLLDLRLPKLDGVGVLLALKKSAEYAAIPVVVLSTSANERDIALAYENHANSYLVKPTELSLLESMLNDLQRYWLRWNETIVPDPAL